MSTPLESQLESCCHACGGTGDGIQFDMHNNNSYAIPRKPSKTNDLNISEANLVKELNELTFEEHEKVLADIHGVAAVETEPPELVVRLCQELDQALANIPNKGGQLSRTALDKAFWLRPSLKSDVKFKLLFLRADEHNPVHAAHRMAKYFTIKLELFGEEKLAKKVTLDDLDENTMQFLYTCPIVALPHADQAGRPTFQFDIRNFDWTDYRKLGQLCWYIIGTCVLENEQAQLKGISEIVSVSSKMIPRDGNIGALLIQSFLNNSGHQMSAMPFKFASVHICINSAENHWASLLVPLFRAMVGKHGRLRTRIHCGGDVELKYALLSFGINFSLKERSLTKDHEDVSAQKELVLEYLETRREVERLEKEAAELEERRSGIVLYPRKQDVLMGRGRPFREYPGNQFWGRLIEDNLERYLNTPDKFSKTCISLEIVQTIQELGGRFIQQTAEGDGWKVLDAAIARDKTLRAFRPRIMKSSTTTNGGSKENGRSSIVSLSATVGESPAKRVKRDPVVPP